MKKILFLFLIMFSLYGCGKEHEDEHIHKEAHEHGEHDTDEHVREIHVSKKVQQNLGFKVIEASVKRLVETIEVYGEIAQETEQVVHVSAPKPGVLESVAVSLGEVVDSEATLAQVRTEEGELLTLRSPSHGIVIGQYFKSGDRVDSLSSLFTITDPDLLRGSFDLYEKDLASVKIGQQVEVETLSYPDKTFQGEVVYISPRIDQQTRTIKVRVDIQNTEEHALKFGMFVTGKIEKLLDREALVVPLESVHFINKESAVFVQTGEEEFEFTPVKIGEKNSKHAEVLSGLNIGDKIVTHGSFNLKSEYLKESLGGDGHGH